MPNDLSESARVLDVAAEIVVNGGFARLTTEGLADAAGVSPGRIVDLFDSLDDALVLMLNREFTAIYLSMIDHVERDPEGGRLSRIYYYMLSAIYERPLARTLYTVDRDAMSSIMRSANGDQYLPGVGIRVDLIERMQCAGMVRRDVDAGTVARMLTIFFIELARSAPHEDLDRIVRGVADLLMQVVDEGGIVDTAPGKAAFFEWAGALLT